MNILGIIPARGGSKAVPRKNIKKLCGKPLLQFTFEAAKQSKYIDQLILTTDDAEIAETGRSIGMEVPFLRPHNFASDHIPLIEVVRHASRYFEEMGQKMDVVMSIQPTNPFLSTDTIDRAIALWLDTRCDSVTTVAKIGKGHPYITKRIKSDQRIENFCAVPEASQVRQRQDREPAYYLTGGLYLRTRALIESDTADTHHLGEDARAVLVDEIEAIDINTLFDFEYAEWLMNKQQRGEL